MAFWWFFDGFLVVFSELVLKFLDLVCLTDEVLLLSGSNSLAPDGVHRVPANLFALIIMTVLLILQMFGDEDVSENQTSGAK